MYVQFSPCGVIIIEHVNCMAIAWTATEHTHL